MTDADLDDGNPLSPATRGFHRRKFECIHPRSALTHVEPHHYSLFSLDIIFFESIR